jgi:hypothetical protein
MKTYKVYQIQNSKGENIGNKEYYSSLRSAKAACRHCTWRMDEKTKIIEMEWISESQITEIPVITSTQERKRWDGTTYNIVSLEGFGDNKKQKKEITIEPEKEKELIIFSKDL